MQAFKITWMIACFILLLIGATFLGQIHKDMSAKAADPTAAASKGSPNWKYAQFSFDDYSKRTTRAPGAVLLVNYDVPPDLTAPPQPVSTNRIVSAEDILNMISADGWQLVWTDGKSFWVRREVGQGKHSYFIIGDPSDGSR